MEYLDGAIIMLVMGEIVRLLEKVICSDETALA